MSCEKHANIKKNIKLYVYYTKIITMFMEQ